MERNSNPWKLSLNIAQLGRFLNSYNFSHSTEFSTFLRTVEKRTYLKAPFELILDGPNLLLLKNNVGLVNTILNDLSLIATVAYTTLDDDDQNKLDGFTSDPVEYLQTIINGSGNESANLFLERVQDILWNFKIFRQNSD